MVDPENKTMELIKENFKIEPNDVIMTTPVVKGLTFYLLENWGDKNFIGLNGFELFDINGY